METTAPTDVQLQPVAVNRPRRPRVWTVFVAFFLAGVAALGASFVAAVILILPDLQRGRPPDLQGLLDRLTDPPVFLLMALGSQLPIGLAAFLPAFFSKEGWAQRLGYTCPGVSLGQFALLAGSVFLPTAIGLAIAHLVALWIPPDESVRLLYGKLDAAWSVVFVLFIALVPGFLEESLFRGYMQRRLLQRWRPAWAILVTSCLFGLMHVQPHVVVFATIVGIWLGIVAWRTDSIWPTITAHALVNGLWNVFNLGMQFHWLPEFSTWQVLLGMAALGACFFIPSVFILWRPKPGQPQVC